jgi:hypothetical protein
MNANQTDDEKLLRKINAAVATMTATHTELVSRSKAVGVLLLEAKKLHPAKKDFEAFLRRVNGLHISRAYDLLRLAGGRVTDEELRQEARERQQKSRDKKKMPKPEPQPAVRDVTDDPPNRITQSPEISAEQRRRENANLGMSAAARSKQNLAWFAVACREYLPNITVETHRQEARRLVGELTSAKAA